jgi:hypothetical protein
LTQPSRARQRDQPAGLFRQLQQPQAIRIPHHGRQ